MNVTERNCGYFCGKKIPPGCRALIGDLRAEIKRLQAEKASADKMVWDETSAHGRTVDEMCFWKYQALWHRAAVQQAASLCGFQIRAISDAQIDEAERELEAARGRANAERTAHVEGPREIGA